MAMQSVSILWNSLRFYPGFEIEIFVENIICSGKYPPGHILYCKLRRVFNPSRSRCVSTALLMSSGSGVELLVALIALVNSTIEHGLLKLVSLSVFFLLVPFFRSFIRFKYKKMGCKYVVEIGLQQCSLFCWQFFCCLCTILNWLPICSIFFCFFCP